MNIFARALGGLVSDRLNLKVGMRGRLWLVTILLILEGLTIILFSFTQTLESAVLVMCVFSIFTQAAEGAIYGVVPYVSKLYTGSVAGLVGSGGNAGSVLYGFGFRSLPYRDAFMLMGAIVISSSALSLGVKIPCHAGLLWGEDNMAVIQARERFARRRALEEAQEQQQRSDGQQLPATVDSGGVASRDVTEEEGDQPQEIMEDEEYQQQQPEEAPPNEGGEAEMVSVRDCP